MRFNGLKEINSVFSDKELSQYFTLKEFKDALLSIKNNGFSYLFSIKLDDDMKKLTKNTIDGREIVVNKNDLPDYMKRDNQSSIEVKSISSEIALSFALRNMKRDCSLHTPELNTITPDPKETDYIIDGLYFDMKSQYKNPSININERSHLLKEKLDFYIIGFIDSDNLEEITKISYYYLPLQYFKENRQYHEYDDKGNELHENRKYYSLHLKDINKDFLKYFK